MIINFISGSLPTANEKEDNRCERSASAAYRETVWPERPPETEHLKSLPIY
jgi:hypothetical protein